MKLRSMMLAGAGVLLLAAPAVAAPDYYNTNPTPQERVQTDQLNNDAAARARAATATDAANHDRDDANQANYRQERDAVDAERAAYERDRARYDREHGGPAHRWDAFYGHNGFRDVLAMGSRDLVGLTVSTRGGDRVGRIRDVDTDHGRISRVSVSIGHGNTAWLDADDLRFDPSSRAVFTDLTRDQVDSMAHMRYPRF